MSIANYGTSSWPFSSDSGNSVPSFPKMKGFTPFVTFNFYIKVILLLQKMIKMCNIVAISILHGTRCRNIMLTLISKWGYSNGNKIYVPKLD